MTVIIDPKVIAAATILGLMAVPGISYSRVNSLTGGIGTSFDYSDRTYDDDRLDTDDYRRISLRPMIDFVSTSEKDSFQFRAAPSIKYDLDNEETDWDNNLLVAADRFISKRWQLSFFDRFIRSDYYDEDTNIASQPVDPIPGAPEISDPTLTTNVGRKRYWTNTLNVASNYFYQQDSQFRMGFNYIALRNDDTGIRGYDDYDRYVLSLRDVHRFNPIWRTTANFEYVIGNYDERFDNFNIVPINDLSRDLEEYRLMLSVDNNSITHNPLSLYYYFVDTNYDDPLRDDVYIQQMRLTWTKEFSARLYTKLGAGPSYTKAESGDGTWGGNGVAELNYLIERGFFNFRIDKRYDVDNFSGDFERGVTDTWDYSFSFQYQLLKELKGSGSLTYSDQDRQYQFSDVVNLPESYQTDTYIAGVGLEYNFYRNYTASVNYDYINQDSERIGDTYDEHRILLTLSWQKELYRW